MQSQKRCQYTEAFKQEAVRLITEHGYGVTEAARNLGINAHMLGRWTRQIEQQKHAVKGNGHLSTDHEALQRLRKENQRLRMEREILKKNGALLCQRVELQYAFMAEYQQCWPVAMLCEVLGVGRSGFYDYQKRPAAPALSRQEIAMLARIKTISEKTHHSYGSRCLAKHLQDEGYEVGRFKVRRLMKQAGVSVEGRRRRRPKTTDSRHGYGVAPHLLERNFDVTAPHVAWCGDVTYIWTEEGWLYTSVLLDLYARKVVGWAMSDHLDTAVVRDALEMALGRRRPEAGLLHHSDRGSQYACHAYRGLLTEHGIEWSMSGKGDCLDNAVAERFFGSLKRERTSKRYYRTRQEARDDVIDYIAMFYNSWRKHSYLGYVSPTAYENIARVA